MPVTLRKRLQCHYCGKRLTPSRVPGTRIRCERCTADNHFDQNGDIADVPAEEISRSAGGEAERREIASQSDVFCSTCLKNQMIYVTKLSEYLPEPEDPRYEEFEAAIPAYKKQLEQDYPQCCARCEPKVRQRLERANYVAKSDHLRRMLQRNKASGQYVLGWRSVVIMAAGLGQVSSTLFQVCWHIFNSQVMDLEERSSISTLHCFSQYPVPRICAEALSKWMPLSLLTGLLCVWWNPKWQHRLRRAEGRVIGLESYYKLQAFMLILRFAAWFLAKDIPLLINWRPRIHVVASVIIGACFLWSQFSTLSVDTSPLVDWHQQPTPLLEADQFSGPVSIQDMLRSPPESQDHARFSIGALSGPSRENLESWRPPTPPADEDSMDWTPSQPSFQPQPRQRVYKSSEPSPFYGTLPAKPSRGRLPEAPPPPPAPRAIGLPPGFFGLSKKANDNGSAFEPRKSHELSLAPPKFLPSEREFVTGLEGIFDRVFSTVTENDGQNEVNQGALKDKKGHKVFGLPPEPKQPLNSSQPPRGGNTQPVGTIIRKILSGIAAVAFCVICISLTVVDYIYPGVTEAPSDILPYLSVVPALHLVDDCVISGQAGLASSLWLATLTLLTSFSSTYLPDSGSLVVPTWNSLVVGLTGLMMVQELYYFCRSEGASTTHGTFTDGTLTSRLGQSIHEGDEPAPYPPAPLNPTSTQLSDQRLDQRTHNQSYLPDQASLQSMSAARRDSNESLNSMYSMSSINTTSTASSLKTPRVDHRTFDWQSPYQSTPTGPNSAMNNSKHARNTPSNGMNFGALNLGEGFGSGNSIAGPRSYNTTPRNTRSRGYR